jgi:hypothetical protein
VVLLDHEGGKGITHRDNKVAVFNKDGDSILSHSTRSLGNAVKDACEAIAKDWPNRTNKTEPTQAVQPVAATSASGSASLSSRIAVSSAPDNADIEVDGNFVGNTPSTIELPPGDHVIRLTKAGYKPWQRNLRATGGSINLSAELEKAK